LTSDELAGFYGGEESLTGTIRTPEEILEKIKSVTAEDIMNVAQEIIVNEKINLAAIGSIPDKIKKEAQSIFRLV